MKLESSHANSNLGGNIVLVFIEKNDILPCSSFEDSSASDLFIKNPSLGREPLNQPFTISVTSSLKSVCTPLKLWDAAELVYQVPPPAFSLNEPVVFAAKLAVNQESPLFVFVL